jgi:hypothetical protein
MCGMIAVRQRLSDESFLTKRIMMAGGVEC